MSKATYENYTRIREAAGIVSDYRVSKETGVIPSQISRWKTKGWEPRYRDMKKIADFLKCSVEDIYRDETI